MLSLGEESARSMGLDPVLWRALLLGVTTLMVAAVVSVTGVISFVGLIAPHIAFLLLGRRGGPYLPMCGWWAGRCCCAPTCWPGRFPRGEPSCL